jgi:hypothetical protein
MRFPDSVPVIVMGSPSNENDHEIPPFDESVAEAGDTVKIVSNVCADSRRLRVCTTVAELLVCDVIDTDPEMSAEGKPFTVPNNV